MIRGYFKGKPGEEEVNVKETTLKENYGGEWALLTDTGDETSRKLAVELAREGYNLVFIVRRNGKEETIKVATSKYGVEVEFVTAESYMQMGSVCEQALKDKDLGIVVTGPVALKAADEETSIALTFSQQVFLSGVVLPRLLHHHERTGRRGALIHVLGGKLEEVSERANHHPYYSAWSRAFSVTFGLGITEQFRDQVDVLTAVRPSSLLVSQSQEGLDIVEVNGKTISEDPKVAHEARRKLEEAEDEVLREFEYVPIQLMYQHLAHHDSAAKQYGVWPFKKDLPR